jgi:DNA-binding MarR family transcriptional regulator
MRSKTCKLPFLSALVARTVGPDDARRWNASLTETGKRAISKGARRVRLAECVTSDALCLTSPEKRYPLRWHARPSQ